MLAAIDPENSSAYYQLALLYRQMGEAAKAEQALEAFRKLKTKNHANSEN